jgi:hypothetical protein
MASLTRETPRKEPILNSLIGLTYIQNICEPFRILSDDEGTIEFSGKTAYADYIKMNAHVLKDYTQLVLKARSERLVYLGHRINELATEEDIGPLTRVFNTIPKEV